jgi:hypothetical protein
MKYNQPYGISDPNGPYINGNPSTGTMGSIPPAASIEYPQREIVNMITDGGIVPDNADLHQLGRAVQGGNLIHAFDSGPVNALIVNLTPPLAAYYDGLAVWVTVNFSNTGPATINIQNQGVKNIVRRGGAALAAGDLPAGYKSLLVYSRAHSNFELYGINFAVAGGAFLPILTANTVLYVNGTTGDDTIYDGSTAAVSGPHGPFKTIMRAMNETFKYGPSVYTMTINVAAGTYPENVTNPGVPGPGVIINGAGKTSTFIVGSNVSGYTINPSHGNTWTVQNCCIKTTLQTLGVSCCVSVTGAVLTLSDVAVGGPGSAGNGYLIDALGGTVVCNNLDILAGTTTLAVFVSFTGGNLIFGTNAQINHLGTVNCNVYATCSGSAVMSAADPAHGPPVFYNAGFVTGYKYTLDLNGVINTQGQSVSWFPGTIAGYQTRGGQYG